jgi:hypothetical protein
MKAFFKQQQQRGGASSSNNADDGNPIHAARAQFEASKQDNLTTQQRIAAELAGGDTVLEGYFNAEGGFHVAKDIQMRKRC